MEMPVGIGLEPTDTGGDGGNDKNNNDNDRAVLLSPLLISTMPSSNSTPASGAASSKRTPASGASSSKHKYSALDDDGLSLSHNSSSKKCNNATVMHDISAGLATMGSSIDGMTAERRLR
jgi:hypothetical protein